MDITYTKIHKIIVFVSYLLINLMISICDTKEKSYALLYINTAFNIDRTFLNKITRRFKDESIQYKIIDINWKFPFYDTEIPLETYFAMDLADTESAETPSTPLVIANNILLKGEEEILANIDYLKEVFGTR